MNKDKRKLIIQYLNSGHSAAMISYRIGRLIGETEEEVYRLITNCHWDKKQCLQTFNMFSEAQQPIRQQ